MKKSIALVLSILLVLGAYLVEGGVLIALLVVTALVPMLLGPLVSVWFSFSMSEIGDAFRDAWSERPDQSRVNNYRNDLLVIRNLQSSVIGWAATIFIMAVILILSTLNDPSTLGPHVAAATVALLYAFALRAILLVPMENSISRKLIGIEG
ncbi:MAG: hypothetical protein ACM3PE_09200 [Deltaproteobacteria bacterium]